MRARLCLADDEVYNLSRVFNFSSLIQLSTDLRPGRRQLLDTDD